MLYLSYTIGAHVVITGIQQWVNRNNQHLALGRFIVYSVIQIAISAEYRDMVPKAKAGLSGTWPETDMPNPRCTCQPDRDLGYHVPVFWTDLDLLYSIHFPFFILVWVGLGGNLALEDCYNALCHCQPSSEWGWSSDNQISQHGLLAWA